MKPSKRSEAAAMAAPTAGNGRTGVSGGHLLQCLNIVVMEPFYLLHLFVFFSYFVARGSAAQSFSPDFSHRLLRREIQAVLTFLTLAAIKMVREETWEAFIADILLYAKGFLFAVTLMVDYHLALCYLLSFLVISILAQQPPYDGLGDCSHLTPLQLESLLIEGSTSRFWLVEFRTSFFSTCVRTSRVFPDLSTIYSNKMISFGIVDLGHFPNAAEKFGISLHGRLPSYILFDNAVEVARLPESNYEFDVFAPHISKKLLCQHFELDRRLIDYVAS